MNNPYAPFKPPFCYYGERQTIQTLIHIEAALRSAEPYYDYGTVIDFRSEAETLERDYVEFLNSLGHRALMLKRRINTHEKST